MTFIAITDPGGAAGDEEGAEEEEMGEADRLRTCRTLPKAPMPITLSSSKSLGDTNRRSPAETPVEAPVEVEVAVGAAVPPPGDGGDDDDDDGGG